MPIVTFRCPDVGEREVFARAPLEILDPELTVTQRTRIDGSVALAAGVYAARATLPDGREVAGVFKIGAADEEILLRTRKLPAAIGQDEAFRYRVGIGSPASSDEPRRLRVDDPGIFSDPLDSEPLRMRLLEGDDPSPADGWHSWAPGDAMVFERTGPPLVLELEAPELHLVVPVQPNGRRRCRIVGTDAGPMPHFVFDDPDLELLLRYLGAGRLEAAVSMVAGDGTLLAQSALEQEMERPVAAMAGAYVLLASGDHAAVADWTAALARRFPWSADALAIHGEARARAGAHDEAADAMTRVLERGLPMFSAGVTYMAARLQQYRSAADGGREKEGVAGSAPEPLARADWLSRRMNAERPFLSYRPPARPPRRAVAA